MSSDNPKEVDSRGLAGGAALSSADGLRTLLGGVGHDMGNALVPLVGLASLLGNGDVPEKELRKKVDALLEATQRLFTLSQKLTCFALREGRERIPVDLKGLLRDADRVARSLFLKGEQLEIDTPEEPVIVRANPCSLLELVLLLLRGAAGTPETPSRGEEMSRQTRRVPARVLACVVVRREPNSTAGEAEVSIRFRHGRAPLPALGEATEAARWQGVWLEEDEQSYVVRLPLVPSLLGVPAETEAREAALHERPVRKEHDPHGR